MAKIAIISQRLLGHFIPILGVAVELRRNGHEVWILAHKSRKKVIEQAGLYFEEFGWDILPKLFVYEQIKTIKSIVKNRNIDIIISDSAQSAPAFVAEKLNKPWISFQTTPPLPDMNIPGPPKLVLRMRQLYEKELNKVRKSFCLPPIKDFIRSRGDMVGLSPYLHLVMVLEDIITHWEWFPHSTKIVGPCFFEGNSRKTVTSKEFTKDSPFILVCTSSSLVPEHIDYVQDYVFSTIDAFTDGSFDVMISANSSIQANELPTNVSWRSDHPIHHLYMPVSNVVITHGGCGTLQKALKYGVPMVIIPLGADQLILADRCVELGVAIKLDPNKISNISIKASVEEIINNPKYKYNAKKLAGKIINFKPNKVAASYIEEIIIKHKE